MTCKDCGKDGFTSPYAIHQHKIEAHGAPARKARERKAETSGRGGGRRRGAAADVADVDPEAQLLSGAIDLFAKAGTDASADERVLNYLNARFGPDAYASGE